MARLRKAIYLYRPIEERRKYLSFVISQSLSQVMKPDANLFTIKLIHTLIWLFFVIIIFYIVYSGVSGHINMYTWIAIGLVIVEGLVLVAFKMFCPLTVLARKYSDSTRDNFDIFLPNWLAKYNKVIFTTIFLFGLALVLMRVSAK